MSNRTVVSLAAFLAAVAAIAPATAAAKRRPSPPLATPKSELNQSLTCNGKLAKAHRNPVLLIHGTFADSDINWSWNYKQALPARGEPACTVDLPDKSAGDIQVSTEYVVNAIRKMARRSDRKVALMSHSQGGLEARWALRFWPGLRDKVSDLVMLAAPNNGSLFPDQTCGSPGICAASLYQMRTGSQFLTALNKGGQTAGKVPETAIVTNADSIFVSPEQGRITGSPKLVTNAAVQDLCPSDQPGHNELPFDGPTFAIVTDALDHKGPAKLDRIDAGAACALPSVPGTTHDEGEAKLAAYTGTLVDLLGPNGPKAQGEPPLACYVTRTCD
jgi:triacylglycerol lipase